MKKSFLRVILFLAIVAVTVSCLALPASAGMEKVDSIYLKIDGIEGEARDSQHEKWIDVLDFSHGSSQSVQTGSPEVAGRGIFEPFVFTHIVDKATPRLQQRCMTGTWINSAELHVCRSIAGRQTVVYKVMLDGAKIVKADVRTETMPDGTTRLVEEVRLLVNKETWSTTTVGMDSSIGGSTEADFDQTKRATMADNGATLTTVIIGAVAFVLAVSLVVVVIGKKRQPLAETEESPDDGTERK